MRTFEGAFRTGQRRLQFGHVKLEMNAVEMADAAESELLVDNHVLLATIGGGGRGVDVRADGAAPWQGPKLPGAAGFFPGGRRVRSQWPAGSLAYVMLFIDPAATSELLGRNADGLAWQTRVCAEDPFISASALRLATALGDDDDSLAALTAETIATALHLHIVGRFSDLQSSTPVGSAGIGRAIDLIHDELPRSVTLAQMVAASGMPRGRFLLAFRARTGVSPHQYILRERLARARALLETTQRSIDEIATEVGCASAGHLGQLFQRQLGISPQAWRRGRDRF